MRLGVKLSPHFAHVLAVVADSAKIYFRASTLRVFLAAAWNLGGRARIQKTGLRLVLFVFVAKSTERDEVREHEALSALLYRDDVMNLEPLTGTAADTPAAVSLLGQRTCPLPGS
jgi:hypothetical protein